MILRALGLSKVHPNQVTFLAGAGISRPPPSQLPTVASFIDQVVRHCVRRPGEFNRILRAMGRGAGASPRFEVLVEAIGQLGIEVRSIGALFDSQTPNTLHRSLARPCKLGAAIVTTNFDNCLERGFKKPYSRVVFRGSDLAEPGPMGSVVVKPHGSNPLDEREDSGELVVSIRSLSRTARGFQLFPVWRRYLDSLFSGRIVVAIGYSCSDDFDITPVLMESRPRRIVWIDYEAGGPPRQSDLSQAAEPIRRICGGLEAAYLRGDPGMIAGSRNAGPARTTSAGTGMSLEKWLHTSFPSASSRQELLCTVLRHYSLHDLTLRHTSRPLSAEAVLQRGTALYYRGQYREACSVFQSIGTTAPAMPQQCRAAYMHSAALFYAGNLTEARKASQRHLELAEKLHDAGEIQTGLNHAAALCYSSGKRKEARRLYQRVLEYQAEYPSLQAATMATWGLADMANAGGNVKQAIEGYSAALELSRQLGSGQGVAWMSANLGELFLRSGDFRESERCLEQAGRLFESLEIAAGVLYAGACLAQLDYCRGDTASAHRRLLGCLPLLAEHLESPALSTVVLLSYLVAKDTSDDSLLTQVGQATAPAGGEAAKHERSGEAARRWTLCQEVLDRHRGDSRGLYRRCRERMVVTRKARKQ